jgi:hypothetical protein
MPRAKNKDNLTREVLEQLIGDPNDDGMPVILAKRFDPQIPTTNNLRDYGFEGLSRTERAGVVQWEPNLNFVLTIDGETGNCRIPDTEFNRKRLKRLSIQRMEKVKRIIMDEDGQTKEVDDTIPVPATYKMMEQSLAQSTLVDAIAKRVMEMMQSPAKGEAALKKGSLDKDLMEPIR